MCEEELCRYFRHLEASGYAKSTIEWKRYGLKRFCAYLAGSETHSVREVMRAEVDAYKLYLKEKYRTEKGKPIAGGTYRAYLSALSGFFGWLVTTERILSNPVERNDRARRHREMKHSMVLTPEETVRVLECFAPRTAVGLRNRAILELLYSTGIRRSEVVNLDVRDFWFEEVELVVSDGKAKRDRVVPVGEYAGHFTEAYLRLVRPWMVKPEAEKALFVSHTYGRRLKADTIADIVQRAVSESGIGKRVTPHTFRHTMATHMLRNKADLRHIQAILGHVSIGSTERSTRT